MENVVEMSEPERLFFLRSLLDEPTCPYCHRTGVEAAPEALTEEINSHILVPIICPHCESRWVLDYAAAGVKVAPDAGEEVLESP